MPIFIPPGASVGGASAALTKYVNCVVAPNTASISARDATDVCTEVCIAACVRPSTALDGTSTASTAYTTSPAQTIDAACTVPVVAEATAEKSAVSRSSATVAPSGHAAEGNVKDTSAVRTSA